MKLIEDDGTVLEEFEDSVGLLVFRPEGISSVIPQADDDDEVPEHILMTAAAMVFMSDEDKRAEVKENFAAKIRRAH